jgi:general secretion pathway protein M
VTQQLQALQIRWNSLADREKYGLYLVVGVIGVAVLWWVLLAPALQTLRFADTEHRRLDGQLRQMQRLQAQAQTLQTQPKTSRDDALRALDVSVKQRLGANGQLNVSGDQATLTLKGVPAESLVQWWTQARINARVTLKEARLTRNTTTTAQAAWDGTLILGLPTN